MTEQGEPQDQILFHLIDQGEGPLDLSYLTMVNYLNEVNNWLERLFERISITHPEDAITVLGERNVNRINGHFIWLHQILLETNDAAYFVYFLRTQSASLKGKLRPLIYMRDEFAPAAKVYGDIPPAFFSPGT